MSGKRLLDLVALFNASRGVTQKHVALRSRQLDVYSRTSTLARAVQNQTSRVTETVRAAAVLASRLNEGQPQWMNEASASTGTSGGFENEKSAQTSGDDSTGASSDGKYSDRIQAASERLAGVTKQTTPTQNGEKEVKQADATEAPLPDGTIPIPKNEIEQKLEANKKAEKEVQRAESTPSQVKFKPAPWAQTIHYKSSLSPLEKREAQRESEHQIPSQAADYDGYTDPLEAGHDEDSFYHKPRHVSPDLSSLPRVKIPKHISDVQEVDEHITVQGINSDSFSDNVEHTHSKSPQQAIPEQDTPEGINTDVFHSPRVAKILGGRTHGSQKQEYEPKHAQRTPVDQTQLSQGIDQASFNVHSTSQDKPTPPPQPLETPEKTQGLGAESVPQTSSFKDAEVEGLARDIAAESSSTNKIAPGTTPYELRESRVPSSRFGRLWNYGGLAAGMFGGAITESLKRATGSGGQGSYMLSAGNMDRLVTKLSRMRGAALKLGQMISFQDSKMLPAAVQEVLQRVQDRADYMPASQRDKVLASNLGTEWRELFSSFDERPLAAASIGQVHSAVLKSNGKKVAVKVQYPGVADSIDSDLSNLTLLLTASRLLPRGLFLDKTIANARTELGWECDYIREAEAGAKFQDLLVDEKDTFVVPQVYAEASGKQVLTMEFMEGVGVTRVQSFTQEQRDWIGTQILRLCLREITEFKYMQTDPNWTNFLYNAQTNKLELLDFGASREYPEEFIDSYTRLLAASSKSDKKTIRDLSIKLGYLTGQESKAMLDAHIQSVTTLAEPFLEHSPEVYDFKDQTITERVKALIPIMIRERLAPPPEETYSLHRKLSGAFLLCAKLGSRVRCRELFENSMTKAGIL